MYDRILIPTDGSDVVEGAVDHALHLAELHDAELHALYVVDTDAIDLSLGTEQVERLRAGKFGEMDELKARADRATGYIADRARERGIDVEEHVAAGRPHAAIADYADDHDVDLIVMGSHGRAGVKRALLGSVTERVLRSSSRPVMVVDVQSEADE